MKTRSITIALLCMLAFAFSHVLAQSPNLTEIIIGEGTETSCEIPFNGCSRGVAYTESIYPADAIGGPCMIYSISFDVAELPSFWNGSWQQVTSFYYIDFSIYFGTTSQSSHSSMDNWVSPEQMSIVYNRHVNIFYNELFTQAGWTTIDLDMPFPYEEGNLVIGISINSYLSWDSFENYLPLKINGTFIDGASLHIADTLTPPEIGTEGTVSGLRPNIKLGIISGPSLVTTPESIDMGLRPSGCWMAPANALLYNEGASSTITSISCDNDFFICEGLQTPYAFSGLDTIPVFINTGTSIGAQTGTLTFQYGNGKSASMELNATAYAPITPDVWEMPRIVTEFPFSETITGDFEIYDNYNLPGNGEDGKDIVWKMTFDYDVYVCIMVEGNNPKVAVYEDGFQGEEGPSIGNVFKKGDDNGILSTGLFQGTYYVVASSTSETFTVSATQEDILLPVSASSPTPVNHFNCYDGNATSIGWKLGEFSHEYQLLFGETNPPTEVLVDWTYDLAESCNVLTEDSKTYYWRVNERNSSGITEGSVWTFSTFKDITPSANNIIYVTSTGAGVKDGSSWDNAASNLQAAIDAAAAVQENRPDIWVAKGTYLANGAYEELDGHACVFRSYNDVKLYGSLNGDEAADFDMHLRDFDNNATILDAENVCYVVGSQGSNWDGFVIQHGSEGCFYNNDNTSLKNCKVLYSSGNGIYVFNGKTSLSNSQVSFHEGNGTHLDLGEGWGNFEAKDCIISYNTNNGVRGSCALIRCQICNNGNGAVINSSQGGTMIGCLVANNDGVGTDFHYIVNSTIVNNGIGIGFGWFGGMDLVLANNIIWGNNNQIAIDWGSYNSIWVVNNAIQDGIGEKSGIYPCINLSNPTDINGVQPCFVEPTAGIGSNYSGGNWSLLSNSPCINNGISNLETIPKLRFYYELVYYNTDEYFSYLDILDSERIQQGRIDIGAYESPYAKPNYQYPIHPDVDSIIYVKMGGTGDGSSWDNATSNLQQAIETAILYEPYATIWVAEGTYTNNYSFQVKEGLKLFGGFAGNEPADYDLCQRDFNAHASVLDGSGTMRVLYQNDTLSTTTAALIDGFTLRNGLADKGAGAYILKNASLSHCTIENNTASDLGGGIYADEAFVKDCFVVNNMASGTGGGIYAKDAKITQSHIGNNEAETGGGVWASKSDLLQCNIVRNEGNGLCVQTDDRNSFVHLDNSILWGNDGDNIHYLSNMAQANTIVKHCAIEGWNNTDNGNFPLSEDNTGAFGPWFVEPSTETGLTQELGDWQLQEASLCIDAGEDVASLSDYDIIGANRIQNGRTDIGAFESPYGAQCVETDIREVSIRQGETYEFYDVVLSEAGTYEHRWTEGSCDSLVLLHLYEADVVYVSENGSGMKDGSSWDNALDGNTQQSDGYTKFAHRLAEATPYTEYWLTDGTYMPCGDQDNTKSFTLNEGVRIYGGFAGTENVIDERDPEHKATVFTGELQADNDSTNNTECLFVTALAADIWGTPSILDGVTLTQGYASSHHGAAMRVLENTKMMINECEVVKNYEGAICNWGRLDVTNSNLSDNIEENPADIFDLSGPDLYGAYYYSAGAISNRENSIASISNCAIKSNYSINNGALFNAGVMVVEDTEFDNNTADCFAVALSPGKMKISNTIFNNNRADNRIGVLYVWDSLEMVNCTISNNQSNYYASSHFPEHSAHYGGYRTSGIEANGYSYVSNCSFFGNDSGPNVGGALSINGIAIIKECSFYNNNSMTPWVNPDALNNWLNNGGLFVFFLYGYPCGSALYIGGTASAIDCDFYDNRGYHGGTIGVRGSLTMNRCRVVGGLLPEYQASYTYQSAISNDGSLFINNSLIANNNEGAIVQIEGCRTIIQNSSIVNNNGGVLNYMTLNSLGDDLRSWATISNSIMSGNEIIVNMVPSDEVCLDAITDINHSLQTLVVNNRYSQNIDFQTITSNHNLKVFESIDGFERECCVICIPVVDSTNRDGNGNLYDVDPMFVNPTTVLGIDENLSALDADWRLQAGSPCINAGDATLIDLDSLSLDLGGEMRVKNCEIDMGACEYGDMVWDTIADMTCEGEPYADNDFDLPALDPGDYVFQRTGDCEDNTLHTLLLHVNPKTYHTICMAVTEPYELNGITYSESGTYVQTLPNQYGCDSIITLHLVVTPIYVQTTELFQGWTWWAPTVETNVADIEAALGNNLESIQSQSGSASGNIILGQMYRIKTREDCTLTLSGTRTSNAVTINLLPGYNWFGFTGTQPLAIENLNITPAEGDKVISQDEGFAIFEEGEWHGTLENLLPGKGYVYVSNAVEPKTLVIGE